MANDLRTQGIVKLLRSNRDRAFTLRDMLEDAVGNGGLTADGDACIVPRALLDIAREHAEMMSLTTDCARARLQPPDESATTAELCEVVEAFIDIARRRLKIAAIEANWTGAENRRALVRAPARPVSLLLLRATQALLSAKPGISLVLHVMVEPGPGETATATLSLFRLQDSAARLVPVGDQAWTNEFQDCSLLASLLSGSMQAGQQSGELWRANIPVCMAPAVI